MESINKTTNSGQFSKGAVPWNKGINVNTGQPRDKESHNYKHGRYTYRRKADEGYMRGCVYCGSTHRLGVHHIDHDKFNNELENLVFVCQKHHNFLENLHRTPKHFKSLATKHWMKKGFNLKLSGVDWESDLEILRDAAEGYRFYVEHYLKQEVNYPVRK